MSKLAQNFFFFISILSSSMSVEAAELGEVAKVLTSGGDVLAKVMWAACIVVGIALIAASFTQFQIHRRNPKLVPLTTPVLYLILGICAIAIPFINTIKGFMDDSPKRIERSPAVTQPPPNQSNTSQSNQPPPNSNDIDAPIY